MKKIDVPFLDLTKSYAQLKVEIDAAYFEVMSSGHYIMGPRLEKFENHFAAYIGTKKCLGISNGLDALYLSLKALDIKEGDEVIVPSNTFIATWLAVTYLGAIPVSVAPEAHGYTIDPKKILKAITSKTKAIIPVHLYGQPCDMDIINELSQNYGLHVLEDAAQAHGAIYKNKKCGSLGAIAAFSFYPGKNLGAFGDAGAITTNDEDLYDKLLYYRNYGSKIKYKHDYIGHNYRLDELQAAFLDIKLKKLDQWNESRKKIASLYNERIVNKHVIKPAFIKDRESVWHLYVIRSKVRDQLQSFLRNKSIQTLVHYPIAPSDQKAYSSQDFFETEKYSDADHLLSLPMDPFLNEEQVQYVVDAVNSFKNDD